MLSDEKKLELEIDRQLKALPEMSAPDTLLPSVMAAIAARAELPWYRCPWQTWPAPLRWGVLAVLMMLFGGLCYEGWELSQIEFPAISQKLAGGFSLLSTIWNTLNTLASAGVAAFHQIGTGFLAGIIAAIGLGYALFLALGAAYFRLAFSQR